MFLCKESTNITVTIFLLVCPFPANISSENYYIWFSSYSPFITSSNWRPVSLLNEVHKWFLQRFFSSGIFWQYGKFSMTLYFYIKTQRAKKTLNLNYKTEASLKPNATNGPQELVSDFTKNIAFYVILFDHGFLPDRELKLLTLHSLIIFLQILRNTFCAIINYLTSFMFHSRRNISKFAILIPFDTRSYWHWISF